MTQWLVLEWHTFVTVPCCLLHYGIFRVHCLEKCAHEQSLPPWNFLGELPSPSKRAGWANGVTPKGLDSQKINNIMGTLPKAWIPTTQFYPFDLHPDTCYMPSKDRKTFQVLGEWFYSSISELEFWSILPTIQALNAVRFPILFLGPPLCSLEFLLTRETIITHVNSASLPHLLPNQY